MRIKKTRYQIDNSTPALGTITEYELIAKNRDVQKWLIDRIIEDGKISNEYLFESDSSGVYIQTDEYIDVEMAERYLEGFDDINDIDIDVLYYFAGATV